LNPTGLRFRGNDVPFSNFTLLHSERCATVIKYEIPVSPHDETPLYLLNETPVGAGHARDGLNVRGHGPLLQNPGSFADRASSYTSGRGTKRSATVFMQ
jgi:hypothetical protein